MMLEQYLSVDDRVVLPIRSTDQHGYLSVGTDAILTERVALEAAKPMGSRAVASRVTSRPAAARCGVAHPAPGRR